jgi:prepilin-type processing-associated H-X9-DG protein/prepilin-type N-terminal cleavage/methylation domain-containing protein
MNAPTQTRRSERLNGTQPAAFTLVELLVVLAVLALGAMLLVPALARTQPDSRAARCLNNHRQLCRAWLMYAGDNNERLATSWYGTTGSQPQPRWANGWLDLTASPDNTNTLLLTDPRYSSLALYCGKDARLFKCPADQYVSSTQLARGWKERVRSVSQNLYAATGNVEVGPVDPAYAHITKLTELLNPKPAETWISSDESPLSINDGCLYAPHASSWIDKPANYHDGGASVAFADGHVEMHRWQGSLIGVPMTPDDPDLLWVRYHTPRKPGTN